ncbi:MAG: DHHA1 domain-containing protein [Candidatus Micrarchaeota archaeon]|nr:DHHA1 domain-containing protein [Candidatus Micrarchaeota archaeon]
MWQSEYTERFQRFREILKSFKSPVIVHHYDTDGISSAAIMKQYLTELGKEPEIITLRGLNRFNIDEIREIPEKIVLDLGTNSIEELGEALVIDHHYPRIENKYNNLLNAFFIGLDGDKGISSSGLTSIVLNRGEGIGLLGAIGDRQYPFRSTNAELLESAMRYGDVIKTTDLKVYGKYRRPMFVMLGYMFRDFAVDYRQAIRFISKLGIKQKRGEEWRDYMSLTHQERFIFLRAVLEKASKLGMLDDIYGDVYVLRSFREIDMNELTSIVNATGREGKARVGMEIVLGKRDSLREGLGIWKKYQRNLRDAIRYAEENMEYDRDIIYIDGRGKIDPSILGVVLSILSEGETKTIVGVSDDQTGILKVSIRSRTVNVGQIINEIISNNRDWEGGGHEGAGGFTILEDDLDRLMLSIREMIRRAEHQSF